MGLHRKAKPRKLRFAKKLRKRQTRSEKAFWEIARRLREDEGVYFWRQTVLLGWIVDFWCPKLKLVVEIDGKTHKGREAYDKRRELVMEDELGAKTIRFTNKEVVTNPAIVEARMRAIIKQRRRTLLG